MKRRRIEADEPDVVTFKFSLTHKDPNNPNSQKILHYNYSDRFLVYVKSRYGLDYSPFIYVRDCYEEIYSLIKSIDIISGVPGIGKSAFLHYILYKHIQSETTREKSFALCLTLKKFYFFEFVRQSKSGVSYRMIQIDPLDYHKEVVFLVNDFLDSEVNSMAPLAKKTIFLCSEDPRRYRNHKTHAGHLYMPVWSRQELVSCFSESLYQWESLYH